MGAMKRKTALLTLIAAILSHVVWGFSFLFTRVALSCTDPLLLLSHRFLLAFLLMNVPVLLGLCKLNLKGKNLLPLLLLGLTDPVCYFIGEEFGLLHSNTIFSGIMIALIPLFSTLIASVFLKEKPTPGQILFGLLSIAGVLLIGLQSGDQGELDSIGFFCLLGAVLAAAVYSNISRGVSRRFTAFERAYFVMLTAAAAFTGIVVFRGNFSFASYIAPLKNSGYTLSVLYLGALCSALGYVLGSYVLTGFTVARSTVFSNLTTAVSVFAGAVILKEPFTPLSFVCCLAILLGIWGVQKTARKEKALS